MKRILDSINSPEDLRKLNKRQLIRLARELRVYLVKTVSETGGHLASNLGVVELTIALHYCFNTPKDKIVWDVGHQSYVHKILTGRKNEFKTLRKLDGLSGFPKPDESPYDSFGTGHSSTSISAALGMACARDIKGGKEKIIAVIGDGSMTGGLAFEGLNNAGLSNTDLIIVLNDNQMSISKNVGALSNHLVNLRTMPKYLEVKEDVHNALDNMPVVGKAISKTISAVKDGVKYVLLPGVIFEEMGFKYLGPIDGNDIESLVRLFRSARNMKGPILIHVCTQKGKGYEFAEESPCKFHGIGKFDYRTGEPCDASSDVSNSEAFGKALLNEALQNDKIVAVSASMAVSTGLSPFKRNLAERFFDVGIAEQHAVTFSAGMAASGFIPVFAVYSSFLQRAYDQIIHDVCLQNLHVVFAVDRAGLVGGDGETHQGIFDLSFLSHMPNMTILSPRDKNELAKMVTFAVNHNGPIALRYSRGTYKDMEYPLDEIKYGKWQVLEKGEDFAVVFEGSMAQTALNVYRKLAEKGFKPELIDARFIKPVDEEMINSFRGKFDYIFVIEDNVKHGGLTSMIEDFMSENEIYDVKIKGFTIPDKFIEHGSVDELFARFGLDPESICGKIEKTVKVLD